jgi:chemotaxis methyl-accepting protein methylase
MRPKAKTSELERLAHILYLEAGVRLDKEKFFLLENRLLKRLRENSLSSFSDYISLLKKSRAEMILFISQMTTHKTFFNREAGHFDFLRKMIAKEPKREWVFLCAACSTGQEVYTLAAYLESWKREHKFNYKILGFDICTESVKKAEKAEYKDSWEKLKEAKLTSYFTLEDGVIRPKELLKENVKFRVKNLVNLDLPKGLVFDVIFIRNVLIYFDQSNIEKAISALGAHQKNRGKLFVGMSEHISHPDYQAQGGSMYEKVA